jgi:hypothetical protein
MAGLGKRREALTVMASLIEGKRDVLATAERVRGSLALSGCAWIRNAISYESFEEVCGALGSIMHRTDIRIDEEMESEQRRVRIEKDRPSVYRSSALDFHTDSSRVDLIAWYCRAQDATDGATLLVDTHDLPAALAKDELAALAEVRVLQPTRGADGLEESVPAPLLTSTDEAIGITYTPWLVEQPATARSKAALTSFEGYIAHKRQTALISIKLEPGEALFINNRRMLHARNELPADSKRHLIRLYLQEHHE